MKQARELAEVDRPVDNESRFNHTRKFKNRRVEIALGTPVQVSGDTYIWVLQQAGFLQLVGDGGAVVAFDPQDALGDRNRTVLGRASAGREHRLGG